MINQTVIAKQLGVSQRAVSFALNGKPGVAAETRKRVLETAERLGYKPNAAARATRTRRFGQVALLESVERSLSFRPIPLLHAVHDRLAENDLHTVYVKLPDAKLVNKGFVPRILRELMVDGLLVNYRYQIPPRMIELIEQNHLPAVWLAWTRDKDCVHPDDYDAAFRLTQRLIELGHRRVAVADFGNNVAFGPNARPSHIERRRGYLDAMIGHGLEPSLLCKAISADDGPAYLASKMQGPGRPTAVVVVVPRHTEWVLPALEQLAGLSVPRDISVATFGDGAVQRVGLRKVTTMVTPHAECGRMAVDMLLEKIKNPDRVFEPVCPTSTLDDGQTVASPGTTTVADSH